MIAELRKNLESLHNFDFPPKIDRNVKWGREGGGYRDAPPLKSLTSGSRVQGPTEVSADQSKFRSSQTAQVTIDCQKFAARSAVTALIGRETSL